MPRYYSLHPFLPLPQVFGKSQKFSSQPFFPSLCLVVLRAVCLSLQGRDFPLVSNVVQFCTAHIVDPRTRRGAACHCSYLLMLFKGITGSTRHRWCSCETSTLLVCHFWQSTKWRQRERENHAEIYKWGEEQKQSSLSFHNTASWGDKCIRCWKNWVMWVCKPKYEAQILGEI